MSDVFDVGAANHHSMSSDNGLTDMDYEPVYCTLHFYYDDPDSMRRLDECMRAPDVRAVLFAFDQWLRNEIKYMEREDEETLEDVRSRLYEICNDYQIDPMGE